MIVLRSALYLFGFVVWTMLLGVLGAPCLLLGRRAVVAHLWANAGQAGPWTWLALGGAYALCLLRPAMWKQRTPEALAGLWLAAGSFLATQGLAGSVSASACASGLLNFRHDRARVPPARLPFAVTPFAGVENVALVG